MNNNQGVLYLSGDAVLRGEVRNCRRLEVHGYLDGKVTADTVVVHPGGRCFGTIQAGNTEVLGTMQGRVIVKDLIQIRSSGTVNGSVNYGQMAMEVGGVLSAQVSNVPPTITGDMELAVDKGSAVKINMEDLQAVDPDDDSSNLTFTISNPRNGFVAAADAPNQPLARFTQADLDNGRILFKHDGTHSPSASFDVVVADHTGATSGQAQTVHVSVRG